jgi:hypothetical protein
MAVFDRVLFRDDIQFDEEQARKIERYPRLVKSHVPLSPHTQDLEINSTAPGNRCRVGIKDLISDPSKVG